VRPERRRTRLPPPPPPDDDQTGWLLTFSDLVLQLFGFALVVGVLGRAAMPAAAPAAMPAVASPATPATAQLPRAMVEEAFGTRAEPVRADAEPAAERPAVADAAPAPVVPDVETPSPEPEPAPAVPARLAAAGHALEAIVAASGRTDAVTVAVRNSDVVLTIGEAIVFPSGSADLLPAAGPILHDLQRLASGMPDVGIEVAGHTDDVPIHTAQFPSNLELSLARAARVARELSAGDPALLERTAASGFGPYRPVASNADAAGRERNRRVEIRLVPRG
jgi:chemotaxis protein MotB